MKPYWYNRPDRIVGRFLYLVGAWSVFVCGYVASRVLRWMGMTDKEGKP